MTFERSPSLRSGSRDGRRRSSLHKMIIHKIKEKRQQCNFYY
jgi:hypothetical protein